MLLATTGVMAQPADRLLERSLTDSISEFDRVRSWCELLAGRSTDRRPWSRNPRSRRCSRTRHRTVLSRLLGRLGGAFPRQAGSDGPDAGAR